MQLTKFDYRLTNNLDDELQKLRCRVNYHALKFTEPIQLLGQKLVKRMRTMSSRYIAVHLRYVLFVGKLGILSCCYYLKLAVKAYLIDGKCIKFSKEYLLASCHLLD